MGNYMKKYIGLIVWIMVIVLAAGCEGKGEAGRETVSEREKGTGAETETEADIGTGADTGTDAEETAGKRKKIFSDSEKLAQGYAHIYREGKEAGKEAGEEAGKEAGKEEKVLSYFDRAGYAAVDADNQFDMVNPEQIRGFIGKAKAGKQAEVTLFAITEEGGFLRYDMETEKGKISVTVSNLKWRKGKPCADYFHEFQAHTWKYTENGYFFIEEYRPPGYDGAPGQTGFRVEALDGNAREWNRKCILPLGYEQNNLLIIDWDENDYSRLDFYDLYERMYYMKYGAYVPYDGGYGGEEYEIPAEAFESVLQTYLPVDSETVRANAVYREDTQTYRYRPRGLHDSEYPYAPYPEVTAYEKLPDGTVRLTVKAVWTREMSDEAFVSELIVRPLENGAFQYISNHVVSVQGGGEAKWYVKRMPKEEWEKRYAASAVYKDGYTPMQNYGQVEQFLENAQAQKAGEMTVQKINRDGSVSKNRFQFDGKEMWVQSTVYTKTEENAISASDTSCLEIQDWNYTEKGWFCYEYRVPEPPEVTEVIDGSCMMRVRPLEEMCRDISKTYLLPLAYKGNNLLCSDWNPNHMEELDYNGLFDAFYKIKYQQDLDGEKYEKGIPKEEFESLMMTYLPVTEEQLQRNAVFDAETQTYVWRELGCMNYAPNTFGLSIPEVTAMKENGDGTWLLSVDAVCERAGSDRVMSHELTVKFEKDGIRFLGNRVREGDIEELPKYRYRVKSTI